MWHSRQDVHTAGRPCPCRHPCRRGTSEDPSGDDSPPPIAAHRHLYTISYIHTIPVRFITVLNQTARTGNVFAISGPVVRHKVNDGVVYAIRAWYNDTRYVIRDTSKSFHTLIRFCNIVWRRCLGVVGKFYRTLWLIYPRHCTSISIKVGQVL